MTRASTEQSGVELTLHDLNDSQGDVESMTKGKVESYCPLVSIMYSDQVKGVLQVEFEENSDFMEWAVRCIW